MPAARLPLTLLYIVGGQGGNNKYYRGFVFMAQAAKLMSEYTMVVTRSNETSVANVQLTGTMGQNDILLLGANHANSEAYLQTFVAPAASTLGGNVTFLTLPNEMLKENGNVVDFDDGVNFQMVKGNPPNNYQLYNNLGNWIPGYSAYDRLTSTWTVTTAGILLIVPTFQPWVRPLFFRLLTTTSFIP